jgi:hypothetical protein
MNEQVLEDLYKKWSYGQLAIEIKAEEGGRAVSDPEERFMIEWTISTVNRRRFINYLQRAGYEDRAVTSQELVKLLHCSRRALTTMIEEVEPLNMLEISTNGKGIITYKASDKLMKYHMNYSKWLFTIVNRLGLRQTSQAIAEVQNLSK